MYYFKRLVVSLAFFLTFMLATLGATMVAVFVPLAYAGGQKATGLGAVAGGLSHYGLILLVLFIAEAALAVWISGRLVRRPARADASPAPPAPSLH